MSNFQVDNMGKTTQENKLDITEIAARINPILKRHGIAHASIFGSALRDDFGPDSDVDLLIDLGQTRMTLFGLSDLQEELEAELGRKVDLVFRDTIKPRLRQAILTEQIPIL